MTLVFYISGHGFGHASRQVEIINALGAMRRDVRVIIRSDVDPALLERTLKVPYELRPGACDTGIVQASSVSQDDAATLQRAVEFYSHVDRLADEEAQALAGEPIAAIVGDIAPMAFDVASTLGVPSIAIGNFTWDWVYETQPGFDTAEWIIERIRASYSKATLALRLPLSHPFDVFPDVRDLPLVARHASHPRTATREHFGIPLNGRAALLSFGGYGLPGIDVTRADCLGEWTIVTTDRVTPARNDPGAIVQVAEAAFSRKRLSI